MVRLGLLASKARLHQISLCETIIEVGTKVPGYAEGRFSGSIRIEP